MVWYFWREEWTQKLPFDAGATIPFTRSDWTTSPQNALGGTPSAVSNSWFQFQTHLQDSTTLPRFGKSAIFPAHFQVDINPPVLRILKPVAPDRCDASVAADDLR